MAPPYVGFMHGTLGGGVYSGHIRPMCLIDNAFVDITIGEIPTYDDATLYRVHTWQAHGSLPPNWRADAKTGVHFGGRYIDRSVRTNGQN